MPLEDHNACLNMEHQRAQVTAHRRQKHEQWVAQLQSKTKFDHEASKVRADIIVSEAWRLEKEHLAHQLAHAKSLVRRAKRNKSVSAFDQTPSPRRLAPRRHPNASHSPNACSPRRDELSPEPVRCACVQGPLCRTLTPKYRALAVLKQAFDHDNVEEALETLRQTYANDHEMLDDLVYRYGPETEEAVSPNTRLRCVEEKVAECDMKWKEIGLCVRDDMRYRDCFQNVIRNLSIMRIFLEGSQAPNYGCDASERSRRDALHQATLDRLATEGGLFLTPARQR